MQTATQRHWDLPSLSDVEAKSTALAASGFTTVDSPLVGSMQALGMQSAPAQASAGDCEAWPLPWQLAAQTRSACRRHPCSQQQRW